MIKAIRNALKVKDIRITSVLHIYAPYSLKTAKAKQMVDS